MMESWKNGREEEDRIQETEDRMKTRRIERQKKARSKALSLARPAGSGTRATEERREKPLREWRSGGLFCKAGKVGAVVRSQSISLSVLTAE
jgi:hypothetical protein